jgi:hypothetical protein
VSTRTDELRTDIAEDRRAMAQSIEAIGDRVSPGRMVERRTNRMKDRMVSWRVSVMGAAPSMPHGSMSMPDAPDLAATTRGNPLAAGLVAFGAGLVAAAAFPATRREAELAHAAFDAAEPMLHEAGKEIASDVQARAHDAAEHVKAVASEGADQVKQAATTATEHTKGAASDATAGVEPPTST